MRYLLTMVLLLGSWMSANGHTFLYVSMAPEQQIQVFRLDGQSGKLTPVETFVVDGTPGSLGVDPQRKFLFASLRNTSTLASYWIDAETGKLQKLSSAALAKGENAAFVATDRTGRWLLSASYMGGKVVVHRLEDGKIQEPANQTVVTTNTAHAAVIDRENRTVFVPHVAPNAVYRFAFDVATGKLTEAGKSPGGSAKAGPRHIALHPTQPLALTSDEVGSSVTAYRHVSGEDLKPLQTLSTLPAAFSGKNTTAEVKIHPSGQFAWVSNRGHDSLAGFRIGADKLTPLGQTPTEKTPRSFEIEPDGRFLYAAGEGTGKLAAYRIDPQSGELTRLDTYNVGKSLTWVLGVRTTPQ